MSRFPFAVPTASRGPVLDHRIKDIWSLWQKISLKHSSHNHKHNTETCEHSLQKYVPTSCHCLTVMSCWHLHPTDGWHWTFLLLLPGCPHLYPNPFLCTSYWRRERPTTIEVSQLSGTYELYYLFTVITDKSIRYIWWSNLNQGTRSTPLIDVVS